MAKRKKLSQDLLALEKELTELAKSGTVRELAEALLRHPVHGPLLRAFAEEESSPEHAEFLKRLEVLLETDSKAESK
ncbi:MAG: hypothetical protein N3B10_06115 [Armatimonadetes bacterium]|nr:hypothetical protein [Armatimonadota bacterium]